MASAKKQTKCIPTWTYETDFYDSRIKASGAKLCIFTDPIKGKGLVATQNIKLGGQVLVETALCCSQNVDDFLENIPVCGNCLVSLETPREILKRCVKTEDKILISQMPCGKTYPARRNVVPCRNAEQGCTMQFCSARCAIAAWSTFHYVCCRGTFDNDARTAFDDFAGSAWTLGGIDYSDTHFLAMRFVSLAMTSHRLYGVPLTQAYLPVDQLIRAPLQKFTFSYLLEDEDDENADDDLDEKDILVTNSAAATKKNDEKKNKDKKKRDSNNKGRDDDDEYEDIDPAMMKWSRFQKYKNNTMNDPRVIRANKEGECKDDALRRGQEMLHRIFRMDEEEKKFFTAELWSSLLGAVLLNGQERTPNSPYFEYTEWLEATSGGEKELKEFQKKLKQRSNYTQLTDKIIVSARGQGIYPIGACFNHSCEPNLQISYADENDETLVAVAISDIKEGDELTISYINEEMDYYERQQDLFEHYLFDCSCKKCSREEATHVLAGAAATAASDGSKNKTAAAHYDANAK